MRHLLFLVISLILCLCPSEADGLSRRTQQGVRKERNKVAKQAAGTRKKIENNVAETRKELRRLQSIEADINSHDKQIAALSNKADSIKRQKFILQDSISKKEDKIGKLKKSFGESLVALRKQRQQSSATSFIFSSSSFSQAKARMRYLKELQASNLEKTQEINREKDDLEQKHVRLDSLEKKLDGTLIALRDARTEASRSRESANAVVKSLKRQSSNLNKVLSEQQSQLRRLDRELDRIIEEEARQAALEAKRKAEEEARRKREAEARKAAESGSQKTEEDKKETATENKKTSTHKDTSASKEPANIHKDFAKSKGSLRLPVDGASRVVSNFGLNNHSEYSKVKIQNNGIDIETTAGAKAVAVYPGIVSMVIVMEGFGNVVLLRHGEYLTVYAGLKSLDVRKGETVQAGQKLGLIGTDESDGLTRLHFEIRHEKEKLDPADWLKGL